VAYGRHAPRYWIGGTGYRHVEQVSVWNAEDGLTKDEAGRSADPGEQFALMLTPEEFERKTVPPEDLPPHRPRCRAGADHGGSPRAPRRRPARAVREADHRQEDRDGNVQYSKPVEVEVRGSSELALHGTFPNPFQEQATVRYSVPERTHVRLAVYDALGRRVRTLASGEQQAGRQETSFQAQDLSSGTYFYRLEAGGRVLTGSVVLVR
jgi:hypothetical protein